MEFVNKEYLLLLLLLIPYILWYLLYRKKTEPTMRMSDTNVYRYAPKSLRQRLTWLPAVLRMLTFVLLVLALARPQTHHVWGKRTVEGIDIMLSMDVSPSMLIADMKPNRLEAAKTVAAEFIAGRMDDNIGLTIFAGEAFTQCPLTTDHRSLLSILSGVSTDIVTRNLIEDGTAIGMGLANAVSRLKESKAKSKVVILLTDGVNNRGDIPPLTAAQIAKSLGVRVYTISVGRSGIVRQPVEVGGTIQYYNEKVEVDNETLQQIAATANGKFYSATNIDELKQIYKEIDRLEKTKMESVSYSKSHEAFLPFVAAAMLCLLLEMLLRITWLRRIP